MHTDEGRGMGRDCSKAVRIGREVHSEAGKMYL